MITIQKHSNIFTLNATQKLPCTLTEAWEFFSSPANLSSLTPPEMHFSITSLPEKGIYQGQIISYKIRLFPLLKLNWVTEISTVIDGKLFVDEQRLGPYTLWHHEHHFQETVDGILIRDKVSYKLPLGILGRWMHYLWVKKQLIAIFHYRKDQLKIFFPAK